MLKDLTPLLPDKYDSLKKPMFSYQEMFNESIHNRHILNQAFLGADKFAHAHAVTCTVISFLKTKFNLMLINIFVKISDVKINYI